MRLNCQWLPGEQRKMLQHPMLSAVTDVLEDSEYLFVVSLRANGGDLAEFLDRRIPYTGTFPATKPGVSYQGCRFGQSCVVQGQRAWIFGGCVSNEAGGVQPTSGLFSFDLEEHHFEEIAAASPSNWPPAAEQQKGAHNAATNMDAWIPEALAGSFGEALTAHSSVAFDGKVFVFGGGYDVAKPLVWERLIAMTAQGFPVLHEWSSWALLPPLLLGPRPCDGRVAHAVADGYVVAYQQTEGSDPASEEPNVGHSLFRITRDQLSRRAETSARDFRDHKPEGMSELLGTAIQRLELLSQLPPIHSRPVSAMFCAVQ
eukprot:s387_g11.t1